MAQWLRICLQRRKLGFDPWVGEDPLEKEMAIHSSILTWEIPQTGAWRATVHGVAKRVRHDLVTKQQQPSVRYSRL